MNLPELIVREVALGIAEEWIYGEFEEYSWCEILFQTFCPETQRVSIKIRTKREENDDLQDCTLSFGFEKDEEEEWEIDFESIKSEYH